MARNSARSAKKNICARLRFCATAPWAGISSKPCALTVGARFDRKISAFLASNPDLTIRTYFKPNDGERYFRRQSKRLRE